MKLKQRLLALTSILAVGACKTGNTDVKEVLTLDRKTNTSFLIACDSADGKVCDPKGMVRRKVCPEKPKDLFQQNNQQQATGEQAVVNFDTLAGENWQAELKSLELSAKEVKIPTIQETLAAGASNYRSLTDPATCVEPEDKTTYQPIPYLQYEVIVSKNVGAVDDETFGKYETAYGDAKKDYAQIVAEFAAQKKGVEKGEITADEHKEYLASLESAYVNRQDTMRKYVEAKQAGEVRDWIKATLPSGSPISTVLNLPATKVVHSALNLPFIELGEELRIRGERARDAFSIEQNGRYFYAGFKALPGKHTYVAGMEACRAQKGPSGNPMVMAGRLEWREFDLYVNGREFFDVGPQRPTANQNYAGANQGTPVPPTLTGEYWLASMQFDAAYAVALQSLANEGELAPHLAFPRDWYLYNTEDAFQSLQGGVKYYVLPNFRHVSTMMKEGYAGFPENRGRNFSGWGLNSSYYVNLDSGEIGEEGDLSATRNVLCADNTRYFFTDPDQVLAKLGRLPDFQKEANELQFQRYFYNFQFNPEQQILTYNPQTRAQYLLEWEVGFRSATNAHTQFPLGDILLCRAEGMGTAIVNGRQAKMSLEYYLLQKVLVNGSWDTAGQSSQITSKLQLEKHVERRCSTGDETNNTRLGEGSCKIIDSCANCMRVITGVALRDDEQVPGLCGKVVKPTEPVYPVNPPPVDQNPPVNQNPQY